MKRFMTGILAILLCTLVMTGCVDVPQARDADVPPTVNGEPPAEVIEPTYATGFRIYRYSDGYTVIHIAEDKDYFVTDGDVTEDIREEVQQSGMTFIGAHPTRIYVAATAAMSLFDAADAMDGIRFSSLEEDAWCVDAARELMASGNILFAGKYNSPDYETLLEENCDLAVESTMILHSPETAEKIEELGIPVFTDYSSYEEHPLGRTEWVKVYGALTGKYEQAADFFAQQAAVFESVTEEVGDSEAEVSVAFFFVNAAGNVVTRKEEDYIPRMISMAGGTYLPGGLTDENSDSHSGSLNLSIEDFYMQAKDADVLIYNGTIDAPLYSIDALVDKNAVFADFKAVGEQTVYTTDDSLYQRTDQMATILKEFYAMIRGEDEELSFFRRVTE